ncbi:alpha-(1,3)-fucosyltransferase C-like [Plodia interpunctella]|uniref:alpha-(1,3)-fucosyltransferase C-like n=1 Tax=Plodia interpunctella TaxID=58824 RepID=UPI002368767E|nr:alpha-(1,3)-fucosyltransferase C-like [Plodia interpunctella]
MKYRMKQIYYKIIIYVCFMIIIHIYITIFYDIKECNITKKYSQYDPNTKHILLWTPSKRAPYKFMGLGQKVFIERNCSYTNCFVAKRDIFSDYTKFHAIIFIMREVIYYQSYKLPKFRQPYQKYVFSSIESSHNYPVCSNILDRYFNWTWSFRLDSDCRLEYIAIRDVNNTVIGPNKDMHWMKVEHMQPVSHEFQNSLKTKSKAAAWFVSNCFTKSHRERYITKLKYELAEYNHTVDTYGNCANHSCRFGNTMYSNCNLSCPKEEERCMEMIRSDYYFYLSFENSFNEDYVTEKLLHALKNNAIPIVYGKANYTRFMPDGIYINAMELRPKELAKKMDELIRDHKKYANYFKWQNHYSYHSRNESAETDDFCAFCKLLNDEEKFKKKSVIGNFRKWWDSPDYCRKDNINAVALE